MNLLQDEEHLSYYKELLFPFVTHQKLAHCCFNVIFTSKNCEWEFVFVRFHISREREVGLRLRKFSWRFFFHFSFSLIQHDTIVHFSKVSIVISSFASPPDSFQRIKWVVKISLFFLLLQSLDHRLFMSEGPRHRQKFTKKNHQHFYRLAISL